MFIPITIDKITDKIANIGVSICYKKNAVCCTKVVKLKYRTKSDIVMKEDQSIYKKHLRTLFIQDCYNIDIERVIKNILNFIDL